MNKKQENFNREANLFFRTDEREYNFGRRAEIEVKPILEKFLSIPLLDTDKYDKFDFIGENIKIELKTRRNKKNKFPTTIVGMTKVDDIKEGEEVYFVFKFYDGIFYWKYCEDNKFKVSMIKRRDRPEIPAKPYLNIPIEELQEII